jgi:hypothetical protein
MRKWILSWNLVRPTTLRLMDRLKGLIKYFQYMLRACTLQHGSSWDKSLPYTEFSYNNSCQVSLKMLPFETLYGRKCRTPLYWTRLVGVLRPGGPLGRRVSVAACPSPDGSSARASAKGGRSEAAGDRRERGRNPAAFVFVPRPGRVRLQ